MVAVFQRDGKTSGLTRQIRQRLRQRGLQVQTLRNPEDPIASDTDVVLIPCAPDGASTLAAEVEKLWSKHWVHWYEKRVCHVESCP